jgi:hypothetical protein
MRLAPLLTLVGLTGTAWGGAALDDAGKPQRTTDPTASPDTPATAEQKLEYGVDLRLREVFVPSWMLNLFIDHHTGGVSNTGFGADFVRRRGDVELQLGFEFEHIQPKEGVWINSGDNVASGDEADYLIGPDRSGKKLGWFSIEFTFLNHAPINKYLSVRYGGGAGLGIITGGLQKYDVPCAAGATNDNPEPGCVPVGVTSPSGAAGTASTARGPNNYDLPPVFPVVNAIIGLQIKPAPKAVINIEGGIRTIPFIGVSAGYFF